MNSPSCTFFTSLARTRGSPLLISIGGWDVELELAFSGDLVVSDGAQGVPNSSMWSVVAQKRQLKKRK